uniref:Protein TIC 214 n=1 Tax=Jasminum polyanthum TaxID=85216 RepID=A0A4D5Y0P6_9LAMI|nr:Ycf1 protein [Jasminum polyanthum]YP_009634442.1 Ycf1 protein [Jasminum polyanthum]QBS49383.1 Ycf1 protein [Jasminum polyanthum]QBS49384.1 Ycf1 protein [Jasminum polyanthum]
MLFPLFLRSNLVSLCIQIVNSVVVVGLYYGFLTTFSIGLSYLFLLRAQVMEEGTEKKVSATTGFITGQLMMFISIYYAPLHRALARPHTITTVVLPYLFVYLIFYINKYIVLRPGSTTRNSMLNTKSMRNFSIQCVFLNNLIFQLFNHFILPSSMVARLVNIYMFRCNNKMLFVTSSFVGWLIGHILFWKWLGLVLVWIRQNRSIHIRSNKYIRFYKHIKFNKYLVSEWVDRSFHILLVLICLYLCKIPSPLLSKKFHGSPKYLEKRTKRERLKERGKSEEEGDVEDEDEDGEEEEEIDESEEIRVNGELFKSLVTHFFDPNRFATHFFDPNRWNRPFRYIKNDQFDNAFRNEMSQYFFDTCPSAGKERISFTYPPSLSTFWEMIERRISLPTLDKFSSNELSNHWVYTNEQKSNNLKNEFVNRIEALDKESVSLNRLETTSRLCIDNTTKEYLPQPYDPFLNGPYRRTITKTKSLSPEIKKTSIDNLEIEETLTDDFIDKVGINRIHSILLPDIPDTDYQKLEDQFDKKQLPIEIVDLLTFSSEFGKKKGQKSESNFISGALSVFSDEKEVRIDEEGKIDEEKGPKYLEYLENRIETDTDDENIHEKIDEDSIQEIRKKASRWRYNSTSELDQAYGEQEKKEPIYNEIRSRDAKRVIVLTKEKQEPADDETEEPTDIDKIIFPERGDYRRDLIWGSIRAQRRKIVNWKTFQGRGHSPLFLDRIKSLRNNFVDFFLDIVDFFEPIFRIIRNLLILLINLIRKRLAFKILEQREEQQTNREEKKNRKKDEKNEENQKTEEEDEKNEENQKTEEEGDREHRMWISEFWTIIEYAQEVRGCLLLTHSFIRRKILIPSLIIVKNIGRMLLFQRPEWYEDLEDWKKESHVRCTYEGLPLSETDFPENWLEEGIQIKILFPFRLKPWHVPESDSDKNRKKGEESEKVDFCFLTVYGTETNLPFGYSRIPPAIFKSFFKPIFQELKRKMRNCKKKIFKLGKMLFQKVKGKTKFLPKVARKVSTFAKKWVRKSIILWKKIREGLKRIQELPKKVKVKKVIEFLKRNPNFLLFRAKQSREVEVYKSSETKKERDPITSNQMIPDQISSPSSTNSENKMKDLTNRANKARNEIERIRKEKKKKKMSLKKTSSNAKRLQRIKDRLIRKLPVYLKLFIQRIYTGIFFSIINIRRMSQKFFLESIKKIRNKFIQDQEKNRKDLPPFIYTIKNRKESLYTNNSKQNSHIFYDLSYLSQAYVFYKLSQIQVSNLDKLKSVLQYQGIPFFLRSEIKDSLKTQGIVHSKLRDKRLPSSEMNQWKNWLRGHYQYDLSKIRWSRLIPQRWRNRVHRMVKRKNFNKRNFYEKYEKDQLIDYKKENICEVSNPNIKDDNFIKNCKYDLLSSKSINSENKKDFLISRSPFDKLSFNSNTALFDLLMDRVGGTSININNFTGTGDIPYTEKTPDRKYFDWKMIHFGFITQKVDIENWITIDVNRNQKDNRNQKTPILTTSYVSNYFQIIYKIDKKTKEKILNLDFIRIPEMNPSNSSKGFWSWMGMNEKHPILMKMGWDFFPEFFLPYNIYKRKPWLIPSQLLLLDLNNNSIDADNNEINADNKKNAKNADNKKNAKNWNNNEIDADNNEIDADNNEINADNKKNAKKEDSAESTTKKGQSKKERREELYAALRRYFHFQLKWHGDFGPDVIQKLELNWEIYSLLYRLLEDQNPRKGKARDPKSMLRSSIYSGELSLDLLLTALEKIPDLKLALERGEGMFIVEPIRWFRKKNGQFIMYQTIGISLVHNNKHEIHQKYREKRYGSKTNFDESIPPHERITRNDERIPTNDEDERRNKRLTKNYERITRNADKNHLDLLVPENIFSFRRRRKLRILNCLNSKNRNDVDRNPVFCNEKNSSQDLDREKNLLMKLKFFLWPNYRLEDLACMNRYWFDTNNGSRFSMLRIRLYPRLKIR